VGDPLKIPTVKKQIVPLAILLPLALSLAIAIPAVAGRTVTAATGHAAGFAGGETSTTTEISVLERFRTYTGHRTMEGLTSLFDQPPNSIVRQLPPIALSDGRTVVIIAASIPPMADKTVSFALEGGTMVSLNKIKNADWEIKVLPYTGTTSMSLRVIRGEVTTIYPLVVAPRLPPETDLSTQGFQDFLSERDNNGQPGRDLNKDGRSDYQDDYIYTANYLSQQRVTGRDKGARQQRALQRTLATKPAPPPPDYDPSLFSE
jgi:hypothetical protein